MLVIRDLADGLGGRKRTRRRERGNHERERERMGKRDKKSRKVKKRVR